MSEARKAIIKRIQERMDIAFANLATLTRERDAAQANLADVGSRLRDCIEQHRELRKELTKLEEAR